MSKSCLAILMPVLLAGCATAPAPLIDSAPASADAVACAGEVLDGRGYDVRRAESPAGVLEAELRRDQSAAGAVREIITASMAAGADPAPELRVEVRAWDYRPATHGLPVNRQTVREARPSDDAVADARRVLEECGRRSS